MSGEILGEYIYRVECGDMDESGEIPIHIKTTATNIVRCRDCKHWQPWRKGAEPECWANGEPFSTPPEGFCAWGERRGE